MTERDEPRSDDAPFPREPWQRALARSREAPPETTDARIRAAARRAVGSRASRWLLPASLAASVLIAVVLVQQQMGERSPAVLREADLPPPEGPPAAQADDAPAADAAAREAPAVLPPSPSPSSTERTILKSAPASESAARRERALSEDASSGPSPEGRPAQAQAESRERVTDAPTMPITSRVREPVQAAPAAAPLRSPEDWYAEIEKLRAEGRHEEAERELEKLEAAYPGWLARRREATPPP